MSGRRRDRFASAAPGVPARYRGANPYVPGAVKPSGKKSRRSRYSSFHRDGGDFGVDLTRVAAVPRRRDDDDVGVEDSVVLFGPSSRRRAGDYRDDDADEVFDRRLFPNIGDGFDVGSGDVPVSPRRVFAEKRGADDESSVRSRRVRGGSPDVSDGIEVVIGSDGDDGDGGSSGDVAGGDVPVDDEGDLLDEAAALGVASASKLVASVVKFKKSKSQSMVNLSRLQEVGPSNKFGSLLNIRGGLSNFALVSYDSSKEFREYTCYSGSGGYQVQPLGYSSGNYVDPVTISTGVISDVPWSLNCLNAPVLYNKYLSLDDAGLSAVVPSPFFDVDYSVEVSVGGPWCRTNDRYRSSTSIIMSRVRVSGLLHCAACYFPDGGANSPTHVPVQPVVFVALLLAEDASDVPESMAAMFANYAGVINETSAPASSTFCGGPPRVQHRNNPQSQVLAFEFLDLNEFAPNKFCSFSTPTWSGVNPDGYPPFYLVPNVIPAVAAVPSVPQGPLVTVPAINIPLIPGWDTDLGSGFWTGLPLGGHMQDSYSYQEYPQAVGGIPEVPSVPPVDVPGFGSPSLTTSVMSPAVSKSFVFDVDLSDLVCTFRSNGWMTYRQYLGVDSSVIPDALSSLDNNALHMVAFCYYPGCDVSASPGSFAVSASAQNVLLNPCEVTYTSTLLYSDFVDGGKTSSRARRRWK